jgi:molecular chaperone GrpE
MEKNKQTNDEPVKDAAADEAPCEPTPPTEADRCAELIAQQQRLLADYDNLKREMQRQQAEWVRYAASGLIEKLVPVVESWRMAEATRPTPGEDGSADGVACLKWIDGVGHVRQQLMSVLGGAGVTVIEAAGVPFDPLVHEAMLKEPREGIPPDTVLEVLESGFKLHDRVIKPAKVKVAA